MPIRFDHPVDTRRPGKAQRFDVFGPKISRSLTLFHRHAIDVWIDLERTPEVSWYCERPLVVDDTGYKRLVDFYAIRNEMEELWFVLTKVEEPESFREKILGPGFLEWCRQRKIDIRLAVPDASPATTCLAENWAHILRELSAFGRYVPSQLTESIRLEINEPQTLADLKSLFPAVDPILLKVASFSLVHKGFATCKGLESQPFSATLPFATT